MSRASRSPWGRIALVLAVAAGWAAALGWQRQVARDLRVELTRLQEEVLRESPVQAKLQTDHHLLEAARPTAADLARLRSDHEALPRLRAEIETLKQRVNALGR